jgi:two-component system CheB/CheR fusion protein
VLRIWVAGCVTGVEAYGLAILLRELMAATQTELKVQRYASDLDDDAINTARIRVWPVNIDQDLRPERLWRFFGHEDKGFRIKKEIRERVVFAVQSVTRDPLFTRLDPLTCRHLLTCRNRLMDLQPEMQDRLIGIVPRCGQAQRCADAVAVRMRGGTHRPVRADPPHRETLSGQTGAGLGPRPAGQ